MYGACVTDDSTYLTELLCDSHYAILYQHQGRLGGPCPLRIAF